MGLGSGIRKKPIQDPGSRGQKSNGSRIRVGKTMQQRQESAPSIDTSWHFQIKTFPALSELLGVGEMFLVFGGVAFLCLLWGVSTEYPLSSAHV